MNDHERRAFIQDIIAAVRDSGVVAGGAMAKVEQKLDEIFREIGLIKTDVAVLKSEFRMKSTAWGTVGGAITAALVGIVWLMVKN